MSYPYTLIMFLFLIPAFFIITFCWVIKNLKVASEHKNKIKRMLKKIVIPSGFVFGYLGIMTAAFIPIAILLLENGVETRIDRLIIINDLLNFKWFFGALFALMSLALIKFSVRTKKFLTTKILDLATLVLLLSILICSFEMYKNTISWLNDVPTSLATDTTYTSNPTLDSSLPMDRKGILSILPGAISSYKKGARIAYIKRANSSKEQESRWEIFLNDADTYKYEGANDFWVYTHEYYSFLSSLEDNDKEIALRGFKNFNAHIKDIGASVDDHADCSYVISTLLQLKFENTDWRAESWAEVASKYMTTALTDTNVRENTRACWLGSIPQYLSNKNFDVGSDEHLRLLASALWNAFNSFDVQHSESRATFYSDVPQYIIDFYTTLSNSANSEEFYKYIKGIEKLKF